MYASVLVADESFFSAFERTHRLSRMHHLGNVQQMTLQTRNPSHLLNIEWILNNVGHYLVC
jgi:hypothetical protein